MENIEITLRFGVGNARTYTVPSGTTLRQVLDDNTNKSALGYPSNVRALIGRVPQELTTQVQNGDVVDLETVGTSKASR